MGSIDEVLGS